MTVQVFAPMDSPIRGAEVVSFGSSAELERLLAEPALTGAVLLSDGIPAADHDAIAGVVASSEVSVIEVRVAGWDGVSGSPLSAACRGVISGFGENGVWRAFALLQETARPSPEDS